jgi:hypothetical protein
MLKRVITAIFETFQLMCQFQAPIIIDFLTRKEDRLKVEKLGN